MTDSELSQTLPEIPRLANETTIDGIKVTIDVPLEELKGITDRKLSVYWVPNASGEKEPWFVKCHAELPDGTVVEVVQLPDGEVHLSQPVEKVQSVIEAESTPTPVEAPAQKRGSRILSALRAGFGIIQVNEEAHGVDPDAVPSAKAMLVVDPQGGSKTRRIMVSPDHLDDNRQ